MIPCAAKPRLAAKAKKETGYSIIIIWDLHEHLQAFLHPAAGFALLEKGECAGGAACGPACAFTLFERFGAGSHLFWASDSGQGHTRFERAIRLWVAEKWEREKTL